MKTYADFYEDRSREMASGRSKTDVVVPSPPSTPMVPPEDDDGRPITMEVEETTDLVPFGLATPHDGLVVMAEGPAAAEAPHDAMSSAVALAKTLLPTAPRSAVEYNLPIVEVQR